MTPVLDAFAATYLRVRHSLDAASEAQWRVGQVIRPREDTTERSLGTTSDPTWSAVSDERRLASARPSSPPSAPGRSPPASCAWAS